MGDENMGDKNMRYTRPFRFGEKCRKSEPVEEQSARINGPFYIAGFNQKSIITIEANFHLETTTVCFMTSSSSFKFIRAHIWEKLMICIKNKNIL